MRCSQPASVPPRNLSVAESKFCATELASLESSTTLFASDEYKLEQGSEKERKRCRQTKKSLLKHFTAVFRYQYPLRLIVEKDKYANCLSLEQISFLWGPHTKKGGAHAQLQESLYQEWKAAYFRGAPSAEECKVPGGAISLSLSLSLSLSHTHTRTHTLSSS